MLHFHLSIQNYSFVEHFSGQGSKTIYDKRQRFEPPKMAAKIKRKDCYKYEEKSQGEIIF
jgi:hypothetical protein